MKKFPPTVADSSTVADKGTKVRSALCGVPVDQTFHMDLLWINNLRLVVVKMTCIGRRHTRTPRCCSESDALSRDDWVTSISEIYLLQEIPCRGGLGRLDIGGRQLLTLLHIPPANAHDEGLAGCFHFFSLFQSALILNLLNPPCSQLHSVLSRVFQRHCVAHARVVQESLDCKH